MELGLFVTALFVTEVWIRTELVSHDVAMDWQRLGSQMMMISTIDFQFDC